MSEETKTETIAPKAEKKVAAKKAPVKIEKNVVSELTDTVADTVKSSTDTVKEAATKVTSAVSDATKSSVDAIKEVTISATNTVKDTYTSIETAISDSRAAGNSRAKKIAAALFADNVNETVNNIIGNIGEATSVCAVIMCAPMKISADGANTLYKKITA